MYGLHWLHDHMGSMLSAGSSVEDLPVAVIEFDSEYAADVIRRLARARSNLRPVLKARHIFDQVAHNLVWRKVESHTHQFLNERADMLANCGASGIASGLAETRRWAQPSLQG